MISSDCYEAKHYKTLLNPAAMKMFDSRQLIYYYTLVIQSINYEICEPEVQYTLCTYVQGKTQE
jgi:hypothetical protein